MGGTIFGAKLEEDDAEDGAEDEDDEVDGE